MKKIILFSLLLVLTVTACQTDSKPKNKNQNKETKVTEVENAIEEIDWQGTYNGILPCSDCKGIRLEIVLQKTNYVLKGYYKGKDNSDFSHEGKIEWKNESIIHIEYDDLSYNFLVTKKELKVLDEAGEVIDYNGKYGLKKTS
ncbi:copper resistance protein NlpE [Psychroflexus sp. ALD_RP9]|uniref:copper resistance protein NlpE n=1 Tax=Psychroflexus sp. ALD_RP9 TaxID=2777186 RepID=UPI001A8CDC6E|nr:copper resistance protein NlpE N-terminal domain-containing protein [Psychroflexus sp. ALD_RP9]QSS97211.1 copper resistance protein NlpE N-terminal domain-containing protein [Psychroflexus sp. ALD_RP9]